MVKYCFCTLAIIMLTFSMTSILFQRGSIRMWHSNYRMSNRPPSKSRGIIHAGSRISCCKLHLKFKLENTCFPFFGHDLQYIKKIKLESHFRWLIIGFVQNSHNNFEYWIIPTKSEYENFHPCPYKEYANNFGFLEHKKVFYSPIWSCARADNSCPSYFKFSA